MVKLKRSPKKIDLDIIVAKTGQFHIFPQKAANSAANGEFRGAVWKSACRRILLALLMIKLVIRLSNNEMAIWNSWWHKSFFSQINFFPKTKILLLSERWQLFNFAKCSVDNVLQNVWREYRESNQLFMKISYTQISYNESAVCNGYLLKSMFVICDVFVYFVFNALYHTMAKNITILPGPLLPQQTSQNSTAQFVKSREIPWHYYPQIPYTPPPVGVIILTNNTSKYTEFSVTCNTKTDYIRPLMMKTSS